MCGCLCSWPPVIERFEGGARDVHPFDLAINEETQVTPWFIATEPFTPTDGEKWDKYIEWSGLNQLDEVVSLDGLLCPPVLRYIEDEYWPHIVNENFMLHFFTDFDFLSSRVAEIEPKNVLCV